LQSRAEKFRSDVDLVMHEKHKMENDRDEKRNGPKTPKTNNNYPLPVLGRRRVPKMVVVVVVMMVVMVRITRVGRTLRHRRTENFLAVAFAKNRPFYARLYGASFKSPRDPFQ